MGTTTTTGTTTVSRSTTTALPKIEMISLKCRKMSSQIIAFRNVTKQLKLIKTILNKNDKNHIVMRSFPKKSLVIWVENNRKNQDSVKLGCIMNRFRDQNHNEIIEIDPNKSYLICTISSLMTVTRPMDCISFTLKRLANKNIWISKQAQFKWIIIFIFLSIGLIPVGVGIRICLERNLSCRKDAISRNNENQQTIGRHRLHLFQCQVRL